MGVVLMAETPMNANASSSPITQPVFLRRRDEFRARLREVDNGSVAIIPRTTCLIVRADPCTTTGEQVRRTIQNVREDGARVVFSNGAYRLRHSQAMKVSGHLRGHADQSVRAVGRVMVGQSLQTAAIPNTTVDPGVFDTAPSLDAVDIAVPSVLE